MARTANKATSKKNAGPKRGGNKAATPRSLRANQGKKSTPEVEVPKESLAGSGAGLDIAGVVLAIVAVASFIAVVSPSSAPVTAAVANFLHLGFGLGGYIVPLVLLGIAALLFVRGPIPVSARTAIGAGIVFVAVISILSLMVPNTQLSTAAMFEPQALATSGGYVGASIARTLQEALGKPIAMVVLVGAVLLGLVIVGFSISNLIHSVTSRVKPLLSKAPLPVNNKPWGDDAEFGGAAAHVNTPLQNAAPAKRDRAVQQPLFDTNGTAETTYLGNRSTTVLDRFTDEDPDGDPFVDVSSQRDVDQADAVAAVGKIASEDGDAVGKRSAGSKAKAAVTTLLGKRPSRSKKAIDSASVSETDELPWSVDDQADTTVLESMSHGGAETSALSEGEPAQQSVPMVATPEGARPLPDFLMPSAAAITEEQGVSAKKQDSSDASGHSSATQVNPAQKMRLQGPAAEDSDAERVLPPLSMLRHNPSASKKASSNKELEQTAASLQGTLSEFGLRSRVVGWIAGPTVTTFKVQPGEGERVSRITNLEDDIALSLATDAVRIFAPIPGTSLVGIEIPNRTRQTVAFGDILPYAQGGPLEFALGRDAEGQPMVADLAKMPHLLIAGTTGSGKSVVISSIVMSLLMRTFPEDVRLIMVDPKRVEFAPYDGLPHLYVPVVTEPKQAASALQWAVSEMERRLKIFERIGVRKISTFNEKQAAGEFEKYDNPPAKMPYLVIVIDELSDLMMVAGKDVEASIVRIAQLGRAAGIHMIVATQRPSSNVVTGLIKANITNRIGLTVATGIDSRVILDQTGAEKLIGQGDMLFSRVDWGKPKRIQGCFVSDEEIFSVVEFVKEHCEADYHEEILSAVAPAMMGAGGGGSREAGNDDPLMWEAARIVVESQLGSTSGLQRRLKVGYARAGRIMDMLEEKGVVGPPDGSKPREVLLDMEGLAELEAVEARMAAEDELGGL